MKKILWTLSVVLVMAMATGGYTDIRSDKCNTYSNDLGISAALDNYSGDTCVWAGSIINYTISAGSMVLCEKDGPNPGPTNWRNRQPRQRANKAKGKSS